MRRMLLATLATAIASLGATAAAAQAIVLTDQGTTAGVALVPATRGMPLPDGVTNTLSAGPCSDPQLTKDLSPLGTAGILPNSGLCWHSGAVMHGNETFTLTWDQRRSYFATTRNAVEQFLKDVADGSGTLSSPYAVTSQYTDGRADAAHPKNTIGRALNASIYGGGCIDYGTSGGATCQFGSTDTSGAGHDFDEFQSGCTFRTGFGVNQFAEDLSGGFGPAPNTSCITDAQIQQELQDTVSQSGIVSRTEPGYTPLMVVLTPPGVEVCLDSAGTLCSANGASVAQFCSYHSQIAVGGTQVAYIVQPWTGSWSQPTGCDEPDAPTIPDNPDSQTLALDVARQLLSPLSQSQIAAIVNPWLNGWYALDGAEIDDNGCTPFVGDGLDDATVGTRPYVLQREFNNGGLLETDPNALACEPLVNLAPTFVAPSAVNEGDVVQFDGSTTNSSLVIPGGSYAWNFGDGSAPAIGPSVVHSFTKPGTFDVSLTVMDRGGYVRGFAQAVTVLTSKGQLVTPPGSTHAPLQARIQLMPQGLPAMLRKGVSMQVSSNEAADGIATLSIPRTAAKRARLKAGRARSVVIARGTVSGLKLGTVSLHLHLSRPMAKKLKRLGAVTVTVRLTLVASGGDHVTIDAAGRY
jgi:hypothetical protein